MKNAENVNVAIFFEKISDAIMTVEKDTDIAFWFIPVSMPCMWECE